MKISDEHPNIAQRDWRLQAITTLTADFKSPWTGVTHKEGTSVESLGFAKCNNHLLQIPVPNPCAIYLSLATKAVEDATRLLSELAKMYVDISNDIKSVPTKLDSKLFDALERLIACVVFSYTAVEAFANESIPDDFQFIKERSDKRCVEVFTKEQIERHINLDTKLHEILPSICSVETPKGSKIWKDYIWLKDLRDRFIHLKSSDWKESAPEEAEDYVWTHLLNNQVKVLGAPTVAFVLIEYFYQPKKPRWLEKASAQIIKSIA